MQRAWRRSLALTSRDWTAESRLRSCLVLAAHPDDETFACGGTILHKTSAGTPVAVFIATDGRNANPSSEALSPEQLGEIRRTEAMEACAVLGVHGDHLVQLAQAHLRSPDAVERAREQVERLIEAFQPDEILVNSPLDYHPDHRAMSAIVRDLVARRRFSGRVAEYPIWYLYDGPWPASGAALAGRPTSDAPASVTASRLSRAWARAREPVASVVRLRPASVECEALLDRKREAIAAYRSQVTNLTGEESWGYLRDDFVALFLRPREIFFPLRDASG